MVPAQLMEQLSSLKERKAELNLKMLSCTTRTPIYAPSWNGLSATWSAPVRAKRSTHCKRAWGWAKSQYPKRPNLKRNDHL